MTIGLELSAPIFTILSSFIEDKVGITYSARDRDLLQEKVSSRARDMGFESILDYYYYLRYDISGEQELTELVETLVVNETYFFREWLPLKAVVDVFIEPWCKEDRRVRIWSAACATGEEPLSLAMLLDDRGLLDRVDILATDISSKALSKARSGKFSKRSIRTVPDQHLVDKYLTLTDTHYEISPRLLNKVIWQKRNLLDSNDFKDGKVFDIILCRNVMIYFSDQVIKMLLDSLSKSLSDDGVLLIGVSESLLRYSGHFTGEERNGTFVYRKVGHK